MSRLILTIVLALFLLPALTALADSSPQSYRFGIFPYMARRHMAVLYGPVIERMEKTLKHPVRLETVGSFPDFSLELEKRTYDIAFIQPFDYPIAVKKSGYIPIA